MMLTNLIGSNTLSLRDDISIWINKFALFATGSDAQSKTIRLVTLLLIRCTQKLGEDGADARPYSVSPHGGSNVDLCCAGDKLREVVRAILR